MFRGTYEHTVDTKGRLSIPAKYREVLQGKDDERLIITNFTVGSNRCLDVYPMDSWRDLEKEAAEKPQFTPSMVKFQTYYMSRGKESTLDPHGRILIPPDLRQYANLKRDVMLVSAGKKFRIWDKEAWQSVFTEAEAQFMEDPGFFADIGL